MAEIQGLRKQKKKKPEAKIIEKNRNGPNKSISISLSSGFGTMTLFGVIVAAAVLFLEEKNSTE